MKLPSALYKYVTAEVGLHILRNWKIRFSPPATFNDPFEMRPHMAPPTETKLMENFEEEMLKRAKEDLRKMLPPSIPYESVEPLVKSFLKNNKDKLLHGAMPQVASAFGEMAKVVNKTFNREIGILCLCEVPKHLLMWAHYADSHKGLLIEFDPSHSFFTKGHPDNNDLGCLRSVVYSPIRPTFDAFSETGSFDDFLTKGRDWEYEHEWRILWALSKADSTIALNDGQMIHFYNVPPAAIRSVVIGCKTYDITKMDIVQALKQRVDTAHIRLYHARLDNATFDIHFDAA